MKKKRLYVKPDVKVRQVSAPRILAGSPQANQANEMFEDVSPIDWYN